VRSEAHTKRKRQVAYPSSSGRAPVAAVVPAPKGRLRSGMQAVQWDQGLHMEALANLAHELRSPMQAILGYLDILRDEVSGSLDDNHKRTLERLNANAHDLAQTVENVMDFSVAEARAEADAEEEIILHELIGEVVPALEAANDSKGLDLRWDLETAPAVFRSRRRPLKAILLNLAINAVKFTDQGSVNIAVRATASSQFGSAIVLEVRDTGPGIAAELVAQAFQTCAQLSHSSIRRHRGMGLGLAVVQRNVEALGAQLVVRTALDKGSAFAVTVPISEQ